MNQIPLALWNCETIPYVPKKSLCDFCRIDKFAKQTWREQESLIPVNHKILFHKICALKRKSWIFLSLGKIFPLKNFSLCRRSSVVEHPAVNILSGFCVFDKKPKPDETVTGRSPVRARPTA